MSVQRVRLLRCGAWLLLACLAAHAGAQSPLQAARYHRQAVDAPRVNGWVQAHSTEGHYSLEIPCAYNDVSMPPGNGSSTGNDANVVACDRQDGVRFFAIRAGYPGGRAEAEVMFQRSLSAQPFNAGHRSDGQAAGRPYTDVNLDQPGKCLYARLVRTGDTNLVMLVEPVHAPNARCGALQPDADRFRRSIAVQE